jgi:hypothetical protein
MPPIDHQLQIKYPEMPNCSTVAGGAAPHRNRGSFCQEMTPAGSWKAMTIGHC